ncbi:MAG: hypothetical protein GXP42_04760 [Chloroflexi bacterium]|nr:hypothetical protein [Chloroflexota bacterium]
MHVHRYEQAWFYFTLGLLIVFFSAVMTAALAFGVNVPSPQGVVNPNDLSTTDFAEPGVRQLSDTVYEAYVVGRMWQWDPAEIRIPAGAHLKLYITSSDVQHGFKVMGTSLNIMVVPGQVSLATHTFDEPGEYLVICHEYCGIGHPQMSAKIIVEPVQEP